MWQLLCVCSLLQVGYLDSLSRRQLTLCSFEVLGGVHALERLCAFFFFGRLG